MRRSDEPIYWGLFGAGGVVAAMLLPILILITGILMPLGWLPAEALSYEKIHALATSWWGAPILLAVIALPICHGMHRIYHGLHDLGVHQSRLFHYLCYGFAFGVSAAALTLLLQMAS